jgi:hypothetical protein
MERIMEDLEQTSSVTMEAEDFKFNDVEIHREDVVGKLVTVIDGTDFYGHYEHLYLTPQEERKTKKKPWHKMAIRLVVYKPNETRGETRGTWTQYFEVPAFIQLANEVLSRPFVNPGETKAKKIFDSVGFNGKLARQFSVSIMDSSRNPGNMMFSLAFMETPATASNKGIGYTPTGEARKGSIVISEAQARRLFQEALDHVNAQRAAVSANFYGKLFDGKHKNLK